MQSIIDRCVIISSLFYDLEVGEGGGVLDPATMIFKITLII